MLEVFLVVLLITALVAVEWDNLFNSVITLAAFSLVLTLIFCALHALDIAVAEAAVGVGATTLLFMAAIIKTRWNP